MPLVVDMQRARFAIQGLDWHPPGREWQFATPKEQEDYWREVGRLAFRAKIGELHRGIGVDGTKMPPRKRPRSDGANGPVLSPHYSDSRFQSLLNYTGSKTAAILFWMGGWSKIVGFHARGEVRGAPVRNVVGLCVKSLEKVKAQAFAWWDRFVVRRRAAMEARVGRYDLANMTLSAADRELIQGADHFTGFRRTIPKPHSPQAPRHPAAPPAGKPRPKPQIPPAYKPIPGRATFRPDLPPGVVFDGPLPMNMLEMLPEEMREVATFGDVARHEVGLRWWIDTGIGLYLRGG